MSDSQLTFDKQRAAAREEMREAGEFFFSMSQFYFVADKPA